MKYVKKILRLLPFIGLLIGLLGYISYFKENTTLDYQVIEVWFNNLNTTFYSFLYDIVENTFFIDLGLWFESNISDNGFIIFAFSSLVYELFLSLAFLMFDCINLVFIWANKFINKGVDLE